MHLTTEAQRRVNRQCSNDCVCDKSTASLAQVGLSDNGCVNGVGGNPVEINMYTAMSFGVAGLQVALLDGSVRMIAPSVSPNTWNVALQPNDGNPPGSDW